jgi:hypothetical protein
MQAFFKFVACLYAVVPTGQGSEVLWKPPKVHGILDHPNLSKILPFSRFRDIKACFTEAFTPYENFRVPDGEVWSPIEGKTPAQDKWRRSQLMLNHFNSVIRSNFNLADCIVLNESMSPWKPRQSKTGNLPHMSFIMRKPKPLGTEFKSVARGLSGVLLHLETQRGKEGMKHSKYQQTLGETAACTV